MGDLWVLLIVAALVIARVIGAFVEHWRDLRKIQRGEPVSRLDDDGW